MDSTTFHHCAFPAVAFTAAFLLWILIDPLTGPRVPIMVGVLALALTRIPMNPVNLGIAMLLSVFFVAVLVYWLVMHVISSIARLLGLVFIISLVFRYLGGINPIFKLGLVMLFVNVAGISNDRSYAFQGPVDAALMMLITVALLAIIYPFLAALRPERRINLSIDGFVRGCAEVVSSHTADSANDSPRLRADRERSLQLLVVPAPTILRQAIGELNHRWFPAEECERLERLSESMQRIVDRLVRLGSIFDQIDSRDSSLLEPAQPLTRPVEDAFRMWHKDWNSSASNDRAQDALLSSLESEQSLGGSIRWRIRKTSKCRSTTRRSWAACVVLSMR